MEEEHQHTHDQKQADLATTLSEFTPPDHVLVDLAELFKIFGDPTRVRILFVLFRHEECVQDIATKLDMTQSAISHQLRILKQSRLVTSRREGKTIFYALADAHISSIFGQALEHILE
jgi:ArsR family transcriptional regulator